MKTTAWLGVAVTSGIMLTAVTAIPVYADSLSTYRNSVKLTYSKLHDRSLERRHRAEMAALEIREQNREQANQKADRAKKQEGGTTSGTDGNKAP